MSRRARFPSSPISYGIIGDGRVAGHFARYFSLLRIPYRQWSRKIGRKTGLKPEKALQGCGVFLVLIKDSCIEDFLRSHPAMAERACHFSGSLVTPLAPGIHPLAAFGNRPFSLSEYRGIPFIVEKEGPKFEDLFPGLENPRYEIPRALKPFYHSLCVLGGNFSALLWRKLFADFDGRLQIPRQAAVRYLRCVSRNLEHDPQGALTGPLSRKDKTAVAANIEALAGDPFQSLYRTFVKAFAPETLP